VSIAGGILAQWRSLRVLTSPNAAVPQQSTNLSPGNPSRENFYAGGGMVASEEPQAAYFASFASQTVLAVMLAGQTYTPTVTLKNTGTNAWPADNTITLQRQSVASHLSTTTTVNLSGAVLSGNEATFSTPLTAPPSAIFRRLFRITITTGGAESEIIIRRLVLIPFPT
jgi:hypothetical protein